MDPALLESEKLESPVPWWRRPFVLGAVVLLLVLSSLITMRSPSRSEENEASRLALEVSLGAREAYALNRSSLFRLDKGSASRRVDDLLKKFQRLVQINRSAAGIRRYALVRHALDDSGWAETLASLRQLPAGRSFDVEHELAAWREILGKAALPRERAVPLERQIKQMQLGWYENLALEALYRKTGQPERAESASAAARRPWNRMMALGILAALAVLAGLALGFLMSVYLFWARKNPSAPRLRILELRPPPPIDRRKGEGLYLVFLVYLVSYAVMQMGVGRVIGYVMRDRITSAPDYVIPLISVATLLLWLAVPLITLKAFAGRVGLTRADIGLRTRDFLGDLIWGIGGWIVSLPVVVGVTVIASIVFRGVDTPSHPAVLELAASRNILTIALLMLQASIMAPLSEELMFRGVFFRSLTPRMQWLPAMVITSSVFAILHPQLPLGFFGLFTLGSMFNLLFALRGSLVPAITAHALNNTAVLIAVLLIFGS